MRTLPLFYFPSTVILVDDDQLLLDAMSELCGQENKVKSFSSSGDCLSFITSNIAPLSQYHFVQGDTSDEN